MPKDKRIRIGDWLVPYDDAKKPVTLKRTLVDILSGVPGDPQNCMNSQCIRASRNKRVFPHPVLVVCTIKTRVYIVDKIDEATGLPSHAWRYELSQHDGRLIAEHDRHGTGLPGDLTLRVPSDPKGSPKRGKYAGRFADKDGTSAKGNEGKYAHRGKHNPDKDRRPVKDIGAVARYRVAVGGGTIPAEWPKPKPPPKRHHQ